MSTIAKLMELFEWRNKSGSCAAENLAAADMAYPALLAIAEAAKELPPSLPGELQAKGMPYSASRMQLLWNALAKLEEVKL